MKAIAGIGALLVAGAIVIGCWQLGWWPNTRVPSRTAVTYPDSAVVQLQNVISGIDQIESQLDMDISPSARATITPQKVELIAEACRMSVGIKTPLPPAVAAFVASNR